MKCKAKSLITISLSLYGSISLWAQGSTTDNRLFTLPPKASTQVSVVANANADRSKTIQIPARAKHPVILNFDRLPNADWIVNDCTGGGTGTVSHGILTIDSPSDCYEYILFPPKGIWNEFVSNSRGWIVETSLKVDPSTQPECNDVSRTGAVQIRANDYTILIIVGFGADEICIAYPDIVHFPMNTTDSFHIYRIEAKGMHIQIYVDGDLAIDHILSTPGGGTQALAFGDGDINGTSLTRWDYFSYDVFPKAGTTHKPEEEEE